MGNNIADPGKMLNEYQSPLREVAERIQTMIEKGGGT